MGLLDVDPAGLQTLAIRCQSWSSGVAATSPPPSSAMSCEATAAAVKLVHADTAAAAAADIPTLSQVRGWDTEHLTSAATHWTKVATTWEDSFTQLSRQIAAPGGTPRLGEAAEAAQRNTRILLGGDVLADRPSDIGGLSPPPKIDRDWKPITLPQIASLSATNPGTTYYVPNECGPQTTFVGGVPGGGYAPGGPTVPTMRPSTGGPLIQVPG